MQSVSRQACEAQSSIGVQFGVLVLRTALRDKIDELSNSTAPCCNDAIHSKFQSTDDEWIVIYEPPKCSGQSVQEENSLWQPDETS